MKLYLTDNNPPPPIIKVADLTIDRDLTIRYAIFGNDFPNIKATIYLLNGRGEFIEQYFEVINELCSRGFIIVTLDWPGQGASSRLINSQHKGHIKDFTQYDNSFLRLLSAIDQLNLPKPYYALAHSMGGNVLFRFLNKYNDRVDFAKVISTAPLLELPQQFLSWKLLKFIFKRIIGLGFAEKYIPGGDDNPIELGPFSSNPLTSDLNRFNRTKNILNKYHNLGIGSPTIGWVYAAAKACNELVDIKEFKHIPTVVVNAGQETVVGTNRYDIILPRIPECMIYTISEAKHEILKENDRVRDQFWNIFDKFIP